MDEAALEAFLAKVDNVSRKVKDLADGKDVASSDDETDEDGLRVVANSSRIHTTPSQQQQQQQQQPQPQSQAGALAAMAADAEERAARRKAAGEKGRSLKERGNRAYAVGDLDTAVRLYSEGLEAAPWLMTLHTNRAQVYLDMDAYEAAEHDANMVLRFPEQTVPTIVAKAYYRKALALAGQERFDDAVDTLVLAMDDPGAHDPRGALVSLHKEMVRRAAAAKAEAESAAAVQAAPADSPLAVLHASLKDVVRVDPSDTGSLAAALASAAVALSATGPSSDGLALLRTSDVLDMVVGFIKARMGGPGPLALLAVAVADPANAASVLADDELLAAVAVPPPKPKVQQAAAAVVTALLELPDQGLVAPLWGALASRGGVPTAWFDTLAQASLASSPWALVLDALIRALVKDEPAARVALLAEPRFFTDVCVSAAAVDAADASARLALLLALTAAAAAHGVESLPVATVVDGAVASLLAQTSEQDVAASIGALVNVAKLDGAVDAFRAHADDLVTGVFAPAWADPRPEPNVLLLAGRLARAPWFSAACVPAAAALASRWATEIADKAASRVHIVRLLAGVSNASAAVDPLLGAGILDTVRAELSQSFVDYQSGDDTVRAGARALVGNVFLVLGNLLKEPSAVGAMGPGDADCIIQWIDACDHPQLRKNAAIAAARAARAPEFLVRLRELNGLERLAAVGTAS